MNKVNKKILWLADYDLDEAPGGAQRSDESIITKGKLLGYNILKVTAKKYTNDIKLDFFDVVITSNLHALSLKDPDLINKISSHKCHIRLEHDSNTYLTIDDRKKLFGSCYKTVFLSDFHYRFFKEFYGDIFKNIEIIYDPIDHNLFYNKNEKREDKILYSGYMHPLKGTFEFFEYVLQNPHLKFVLAGWTDNHCLNFLARSIPNIEYIGIIKYEKMPDIYNKYKTFFYTPNLNEPFCRSVAEALSCGMSIMSNQENKIGCLEEIKKFGFENFKQKCSSADFDFWNLI